MNYYLIMVKIFITNLVGDLSGFMTTQTTYGECFLISACATIKTLKQILGIMITCLIRMDLLRIM